IGPGYDQEWELFHSVTSTKCSNSHVSYPSPFDYSELEDVHLSINPFRTLMELRYVKVRVRLRIEIECWVSVMPQFSSRSAKWKPLTSWISSSGSVLSLTSCAQAHWSYEGKMIHVCIHKPWNVLEAS